MDMKQEPVAIIGIGCRFPGRSNSPEEFWDMMSAGTNAVTPIPDDRFNIAAYYHPKPGVDGKTCCRWAGLVDEFDKFDPGFFGISRREADFVDPQHRLLLESSWRAIEDAQETVDLARGSNIGVFAGISTNDFHLIQNFVRPGAKSDIFSATGSVHSIAANRVSYALNLVGPSMAIDTACSSALVAVHLAVESLLRGDCELALAGGVNSICSPNPFLCFSTMSMLSPTGRCRPFDSCADGFVRSEGAGMILLKPLSVAMRDGNRIYATIASTASNQDGRTPGLTVPNPIAQESLIRAALKRAEIRSTDIDYMEAHGTGTPIGDPIEAHAIGMALGEGRKLGNPCAIGSVKGNIGHLEAGAGAAGIIKAALALHHRVVPPTINHKTANPRIDFDELRLRVVTEAEELPSGRRLPYAAVNAFGFGGANAHAVLQGAPRAHTTLRQIPKKIVEVGAEADGGIASYLLPVSAGSQEGVRAVADQLHRLLENDESVGAADLSLTMGVERVHFPQRAAIVARSREEMSQRLTLLAKGEGDEGISEGTPLDDAHSGPVFVFSGQGAQWHAMGRGLLATSRVFRGVIERCDRFIGQWGEWSLLEELGKSKTRSRINETAIAQPAIFAVQAGLAELWKSWGITPSATVGHSVGEVAAAYVSGALTLEEGCRVIHWRGACMDATTERGEMLAAALTEEEANEVIAPYEGRVHIAAFNAPSSVTLSGDSEPIRKIAARLESGGVFNRVLRVGYAFHSHHMAKVKMPLLDRLGTVECRTPTIPVYSTVSGKRSTVATFNADYWWRNVREPVRFADAISGLLDDGHRLFVELGAHPILAGPINECLEQSGRIGGVVPTLQREVDDDFSSARALGRYHLLGGDINWNALYPKVKAVVKIPEMPFLREHHWAESEESKAIRCGRFDHPFLQRRERAAEPTWTSVLSLDAMPMLRDHMLLDSPVFPGAAFLEAAAAAGRILNPGKPILVENMEFTKALFLPNTVEPTILQLRYNPVDSKVVLASRSSNDAEWTTHATGRIRIDPSPGTQYSIDGAALVAKAHCGMPGRDMYRWSRNVGLSYGPYFRVVKMIHKLENKAFYELELNPKTLKERRGVERLPELLDGVAQGVLYVCSRFRAEAVETNYPLVRCGSYRLLGKPEGRKFHSYMELTHTGERIIRGDVRLLDRDCKVIAELRDVEWRSAVKSKGMRATSPEQCLYVNRWYERTLEAEQAPSVAEADASLSIPRWPEVDEDDRSRLSRLNRALDTAARGALRTAGTGLGKSPNTAIKAAFRDQFDGLVSRVSSARGKRAEFPFDKLLKEFPAAYPEVVFLERVSRSLPALLRGKVELAEVLDPDGSVSLEEHMLQDGETFRADHARMRQAVRSALAKRPGRTPLEVLIVGAGTGSAVAELLPEFDPRFTTVLYAEKDERRLKMAEQKFFDRPFVQYFAGEFPKGKVEREFDLIVQLGMGVGKGMDEARARKLLQCLKSKGICLMEVGKHAPIWRRLCFGLVPEVASRFLPMSVEGLEAVLERSGFAETSVSTESPTGGMILAARGPKKRAARKTTDAFSLEALQVRAPRTWVYFADDGGVLEKTIEHVIGGSGDRVVRIEKGRKYSCKGDIYKVVPGDLEQIGRLFRSVMKRVAVEQMHILCGWGLDLPHPKDYTPSAFAAAEKLAPLTLLGIAKMFPPTSGLDPAEIHLLTRGAQATREGIKGVNPVGATVVGIGRCLQHELPATKVRLIDLDPAAMAGEAALLAREVRSGSKEAEVALRGRKRHVLRVSREPLARGKRSRNAAGHRLEVLTPGMLDSITFLESRRRRPRAGEVEIAIKAAAMNFRDVMKALGIYPSDADVDRFIGDECSGVIERVGAGVTDWKVGDRVMAIGVGCFGSHMTCPAEAAMPMPEGLEFSEAATFPVAYMTAVHSLCRIADLKRGETVLVQAGSGGVGLAAIHLAKAIGARVFATAGSDEKRGVLESLGVERVFDSRSLAFADGVRDATDGRGVDVVLNSLSGLAIEKGLESLAPHGRFVEIGKRDIHANATVGLRPLRNNASMTVVDLGQAMNDGGAMLRGLLSDVCALVRRHDLPPLPHRIFPMSRARDAFRCMAQARHIGKIVMTTCGRVEAAKRPVESSPRREREANRGAYVVTGGLTGYGLEYVKDLYQRGVEAVWAVSRSGKVTPEIEELQSLSDRHGVKLFVESVDVTSMAAVTALVGRIRKTGIPLRGIVHSAMVLDDKTMANMTPEQMSRVLAPKVQGAWNLHEATRGESLLSFIMFSSVSAALGNAGQGNYAAANCFLDALAHYRRSIGLPALAINWGQLDDVGVVARDPKRRESLTRQGIVPMPAPRVLGLAHQLKVNGHVQTGAYPIEWRAFLAAHPQVREFSRYEEVAAGLDDDRGDAEPMSARQTFLDTPPAKRRAVMIGMLKEEVAKVLRTSVARIREDRPLTQMGLDSLMSFELLMRIESMFDLSRPPTRVNPETTLVDLGISLLELVAGGGEADLAAVSLRGGTAASGGATDPATLPLPDGCLVDLRKAGDWSPLFAFHPAGGSIKVFDPLVAALPEECPFTGVQTRVFFAPGGEFLTLEGMARSYARAIMRRQPEGPIKLLGFAFGSHTAVAVAAELERVGREVSWIGQIDPIDQVFQPGMKNDQEVIDWHIRDFARMRGAETVDGVVIDEDVRDMVEAIIGRVGRRSIEERAGWLADWHRDKRFMRRGTEERVGELVLTLHFHHTDLARGRGQVEIESPVEVWRGSHRWANAAGDLLISRGGITEHRMPIDHSEFFTGGNPAILAERIKASLEEIESKTARG